MKISELTLEPIKAKNNGLVGFAQMVLNDCLFISSIAIFTRPDGGYRCVYPTKLVGKKNIGVFYPITRELSSSIEEKVTKQFKKLKDKCNEPITFSNPEESFK